MCEKKEQIWLLAWVGGGTGLLAWVGPRGAAFTCCVGINDVTAPNVATIAIIARIVVSCILFLVQYETGYI